MATILLTGLLLLFTYPVPSATFGFGAIGTLSDGAGMPVLLVLTTAEVVGAALAWAATFRGAAVWGVGARCASAPPQRRPHLPPSSSLHGTNAPIPRRHARTDPATSGDAVRRTPAVVDGQTVLVRRPMMMRLAIPTLLMVGLLLVFVYPVSGTTFSFGSLGTIGDGGGSPILLVVTPAKVVGAILVWTATVAAAVAAGHRPRSGQVPSQAAVALAVAGLLLVVGLLLVFVWPQSEAWFTYGSFTTFGHGTVEPYVLILTTAEIVGALMVWASTLLVGFVAGERLLGSRVAAPPPDAASTDPDLSPPPAPSSSGARA